MPHLSKGPGERMSDNIPDYCPACKPSCPHWIRWGKCDLSDMDPVPLVVKKPDIYPWEEKERIPADVHDYGNKELEEFNG